MNQQIVSLIDANLPCGKCEDCLEHALRQAFAAIESKDPDMTPKCGHAQVVAREVAKWKGEGETVAFVANIINSIRDWPISWVMELAADIVGWEGDIEIINHDEEVAV